MSLYMLKICDNPCYSYVMPAVEENIWLRLRIARQIRSLNVLQLTLRKERLGETKHILDM
jgi:hypothetical protein